MTESFEIGLAFELPAPEPDGERGWVVWYVRVSSGVQPNQYRLEEALFPTTVLHEVDEDTMRSQYWEPPVTYHDVFEVAASEALPDEKTFIFRRLVVPAPGRRYEYRFDHEYLRRSKLSTREATALKERIEQLGAYCAERPGQVRDLLFVYVPPGISYDPTSDVEGLPPFEADY